MDSSQRDDLDANLRQIVSDILKVPLDTITPESKLTDLGHVESIQLLRIIGMIERRFGIELDNELMFRHATFAEITAEVATARAVDRTA